MRGGGDEAIGQQQEGKKQKSKQANATNRTGQNVSLPKKGGNRKEKKEATYAPPKNGRSAPRAAQSSLRAYSPGGQKKKTTTTKKKPRPVRRALDSVRLAGANQSENKTTELLLLAQKRRAKGQRGEKGGKNDKQKTRRKTIAEPEYSPLAD